MTRSIAAADGLATTTTGGARKRPRRPARPDVGTRCCSGNRSTNFRIGGRPRAMTCGLVVRCDSSSWMPPNPALPASPCYGRARRRVGGASGSPRAARPYSRQPAAQSTADAAARLQSPLIRRRRPFRRRRTVPGTFRPSAAARSAAPGPRMSASWSVRRRRPPNKIVMTSGRRARRVRLRCRAPRAERLLHRSHRANSGR